MRRVSPVTPDARAPRSRSATWIVGVLGYAALIVLAARLVNKNRFVEALERLELKHLGAVLACVVLHIAARSFRFHRLVLRAHPSNYQLRDGIRIFLLGLAASSVTPARAGDIVKARLVRPYGVPAHVGLGLVFIERILDLLVIASTIVVTGIVLSGRAGSDGWRAAATLLLAGLIAGVAAVTVTAVRRRAVRAVGLVASKISRRLDATKVEDTLDGMFGVWDTVFASPASVARYFALSSVAWLADFIKLWLVLRFLGTDVDLIVTLFVYPVSLIAGILTLLPFSEGVVGVTGVALLGSLASVDGSTAGVAIVIDRGAATLTPFALWLVFSALRMRPPAEPRSGL